MVVIGGLGTTYGPVLGAVYVIAFPYVIRDLSANAHNVNLFIYGASIVIVLLWEPTGMVGFGQRIMRRFSKRSPAAPPAVSTPGEGA
jgi:branched-chain amino acid transport system permease protein